MGGASACGGGTGSNGVTGTTGTTGTSTTTGTTGTTTTGTDPICNAAIGGSCSFTQTGVSRCVDFGTSFTAQDDKMTCDAMSGTVATTPCPAANRSVRCYATASKASGAAYANISSYYGLSAGDIATYCASNSTICP
jgi:hypothetical protein